MHNMIGMTLGNRYRIDEALGRGGMAEVYKVWDMERATYLALKLLRQDLAEDRVFVRRFQREAQTLEKLQHPNIVRFYGIDHDMFRVFMLMEYIQGTTLQRILFMNEGKPLSHGFAYKTLTSVCSALHYAHQQGLVHCDIKPGNIMIDDSGKVLLTDFGIARMSDAATATMVGFGTPAYMAPELVMGRDPSPQSDVYSLGILLYEMVTGGERPFTGERAQTTGPTSERVRWEQLHLPAPSPKAYNRKISNEMEAVILRCLAKDPAERYSSALNLHENIEQAFPNESKTQSFFQETQDSVDQRQKWVSGPTQQSNRRITQSKYEVPGQAYDPSMPKKTGVPMWAFIPIGVILLFMFVGFIGGSSLIGRDRSDQLGNLILDSQTIIEQEEEEIIQEATATITLTRTPVPTPSQTPLIIPTMELESHQEVTSTTSPTEEVYITPTPKIYYPISGCAPSHLRLGDSAFIGYDGTKNSLRSEPDTHPSDNIIAEAQPGEVLLIIGGPECNHGWVLWEVETTRGEQGWTPEGNGTDFWLLPLTTRQLCEGALPSRLVVGDRAKVKEEPALPNRLRVGPSTLEEVVERIPPGEWMLVLEGPHCGQNANWWKVESISTGIVGWTMEGNKQIYYLAPEP